MHYTPVALADFLARRTLHHLSPRSTVRVLDPACGDGELLRAFHAAFHAAAFNAAAFHAAAGPQLRLELVGYDLDEEALAVAQRRAPPGTTFHHADFIVASRSLPPSSFDVVISNPPYVRTQQLGTAAAQLLANEFGLTGRIDLTHPFLAISSRLLREEGVLGLLCSNRFLTTQAGENVRQIFRTSLPPREIHDLGDTRLFSASVLPAVTIAVKDARAGVATFTSAYEAPGESPSSERDLFEALGDPAGGLDEIVSHEGRSIRVRRGVLQPQGNWRLSHPEGDDWLARVGVHTWMTFGDVAKIRVGIKSTADRVFISDHWDDASPAPEPALLRPLVTHHDVTPWRIGADLPSRVLYPYDLTRTKRTVVDMTRYPKAMRYLENHQERLRARTYVTEGGREWFEPWVAQKPALWSQPKIVFPDISEAPRFAYDRSGAVVNGDCYWISLDDIQDEDIAYLMLGVANSALGIRFYDEVCGNKLYWGRRRWITQYVSLFPLPDPERSTELISAVRALIEGRHVPTDAETATIDALVERAFGEQ